MEMLGPVFCTLDRNMKGLGSDVVTTDGFYRINAAWGVSNNAASLGDRTSNRSIATVNRLNEGMDMLDTESSECMATFAISVAYDFERKNGKIVPNMNKYEFSIKCHNVFHFKKTPYHRPPQIASVEYVVTNDMFKGAEPLTKPAVMDQMLGSMSGLFGDLDTNPFANVTEGMAASQGENTQLGDRSNLDEQD